MSSKFLEPKMVITGGASWVSTEKIAAGSITADKLVVDTSAIIVDKLTTDTRRTSIHTPYSTHSIIGNKDS